MLPKWVTKPGIAYLAFSDGGRKPDQLAEQDGTSNGGQRPSLNSGFHFRRGWPRRSQKRKLLADFPVFYVQLTQSE
jgi:hypothetical protein